MTSKLSQTAAVVECVLFLENRTMNTQEISRYSHINEERVIEALKELKGMYDENGHGIVLLESEEGYQFVPRESLHERLKKTYGKKVDTRLTRAAVETLTIIAYNQPVKKREIDNIRGSNSEDIVKRLRELDYIKVIDRTEEPGHPARYGTTRKFLYDFNLSSIADLPRLDKEESERFEDLNLDRNNNKTINEDKNQEVEEIVIDEQNIEEETNINRNNPQVILIKKSLLEDEEENENNDVQSQEEIIEEDIIDIQEQKEEVLEDDTVDQNEKVEEDAIEKDKGIEEDTTEVEDNLTNDKSKLFDSVKKIDKNELQRILDFSDDE